ncbi:hypothetical protein BH11PLA1_BH11PLA1_24320 [soil metagenome]
MRHIPVADHAAVSARSMRLETLAALMVLCAGAAANAETVNQQFFFTDRTGTQHPLRFAYGSSTYNTNFSSNNAAGSGYVDGEGRATYTGSATFGSIDFYGVVQSRFGSGATEWFRVVNDAGNLYQQAWGPINTSGTASGTTSILNDDFSGRSFQVGQAFAYGRQYAVDRLGSAIGNFTVQYDAGYTGASFYNGSLVDPRFRLNSESGWASWDVMLHELGHYVGKQAGIDASPGGAHSFGGDNIRGTGRPADGAIPAGTGLGAGPGAKLAWSEAFATYFGLSAVSNGPSGAGGLQGVVPDLSASATNNGNSGQDYDNRYAQYSSAGSRAYDFTDLRFNVSAETPVGRTGNGTNTPVETANSRRGEGDEYSVLLALWDIMDGSNEAYTDNSYGFVKQYLKSDRISYGDLDTWNKIIKVNAPQTFRQAWANITTDAGTAAGRAHITGLGTVQKAEAVAAFGEVLEAAGISAVPAQTFKIAAGGAVLELGFSLSTNRPRFTFVEQNNSNSSYFRVLVFAFDWSSIVFAGDRFADPTPGVINILTYDTTADIALGHYWWVVLNSPVDVAGAVLDADNYAYYWSGARELWLVPTPGALSLLAAAGVLASRRRRGV